MQERACPTRMVPSNLANAWRDILVAFVKLVSILPGETFLSSFPLLRKLQIHSIQHENSHTFGEWSQSRWARPIHIYDNKSKIYDKKINR